MESLRNFLTGPRLIFIVLVCALPFVFLGTGSLTGAFGGSFGSINGEDVTEADLQLASNTAVQRFQSVLKYFKISKFFELFQSTLNYFEIFQSFQSTLN